MEAAWKLLTSDEEAPRHRQWVLWRRRRFSGSMGMFDEKWRREVNRVAIFREKKGA